MTEKGIIPLRKATSYFKVGRSQILYFLTTKGFIVADDPKTKLALEQFELLIKEYGSQLNQNRNSGIQKEALEENPSNNVVNDDEVELDYTNYEEEAFYLMTDGNAGSYEDFLERGGTMDDIDNAAGRN